MTSKYQNNNIHIFIGISASLHILIILLLFFGLPFSAKEFEEEKVLTFEILPISSVNNLKTKKIQKEESIDNIDAKKIEKSKEAERQQEIPEEKKEVKVPEVPKELPKENKEPLPQKEKKEEQKPKEEKKEEKKEDKKKTDDKKTDDKKKDDKKKKTPNDKELDSLLKNLEKESEGDNDKSRKVKREKKEDDSDAFGPFDNDNKESLTTDEVIKQQINRHWRKPPGSINEKILLTIRLSVELDGTITDADIISISCPDGKDVLCNATRESILRAITNASPLVNLLPEDYSTWKNIKLNFRP